MFNLEAAAALVVEAGCQPRKSITVRVSSSEEVPLSPRRYDNCNKL
jgi:hypothetical protein